jgi:GEVED domain/Secretion system C-terminal sorting domain/Ig-like domain CHU_C associated
MLTGNFEKPADSRFLNLRSVLGGFLLLLSGAAYSQTFQPLTVTSGFTDDVIANGVGDASASTTNDVDGSNYSFICSDFQATSSSAAITYGLPTSGTVTSLATTGLTYQLGSYSGNNSLRIATTNGSGTLNFTQQVSASTLYVLGTSGSGASTINVVVNFTDGTSQTTTGATMPDWFDSTVLPVGAWGIGRIQRLTNTPANPTNNPRLYQLAIPIALDNQSKTISGITATRTSTSGYLNIFAVSALTLGTCPSITSTSYTTASFTSAAVNWVLGSYGSGGSTATYTLEVYTDNTYTTPITGSPFTGITASTYTLTGLTFGTPYYYRVKANNGSCDSAYATGTLTLAYCTPTSTYGTSYYISNFTTTGGYTNIANSTSSGSYNNYSTMSVSKPAGTSFNFSITKINTSTQAKIFVDWNQDLDFDDAGETVATFSNGATVNTGAIAIPAGTPVGNYRMRVRSTYYYNTTLTACGAFTYGEAEDYTLSVVTAPADCITPDAPAITATVTGTTISGTITPLTTAPTGYMLVRSSSSTLSAQPVTGTSYAVGAELGGGTVIANSATLSTFSNFVGANTRYYYYIFAYNDGGATCFGPKYSVAGVANAVSCAKAVQVASASNITHNSAILNWSNIVGIGGVAATYTVEVYTDAALTALFGSYTSTTPSYTVTALTNGIAYYYRVKGEAGDCDDDSWSATSSFTAQNSYTPLNATGYNADVIANGTGIANVSTTNAVDAVNNCYIALDYERVSGTVTTIGLPLNRTLTSSALTGLKFLMPDYSANNSLRLPAQNQAGTLALTNPVKLTDLYLAVTSGSGTSTISAAIQFQDGTSQAATSISLLDWYGTATTAQPALISNIGRANRANDTGTIETGASKVFYVTIPVDAANQTKLVSGVLVTKTSTGTTEPVPNIFAISGKAIEVCPTLATATAGTPTSDGATITWTLAANAAAATTYTVEIFSDAAFTTAVTGSPFTGITAATYTATGLSPMTTYYFRVKGINADCTSAYVTGSFTTACATPAAPAAAAQTLCGPATISQLTATGVTGATFTWYTTNTSTTPIATTTALSTGLYFVSQTVGTCESARTPVSVTVNTTAAPTAAAQSFCGSATVSQLVATTLTGATVTWSTTSGGTALEATAALATGTYYVTQTLNGCTSTATTVAVTVNAIPAAPTAVAQSFCGSATVADLNVTGTGTITWSLTEGGAALEATAALATGTYYVTQTLNGCTSTATTVAVTVNTIPAAPTAVAQSFCGSATVADLDVTGTGTITWSLTEGGAALEATTALATGTYYVTQTLNGCTSTATTVAVTVSAFPTLTITNPAAACAPGTVDITAAEVVAGSDAGLTYTYWADPFGTVAFPAPNAITGSGTFYIKAETAGGCSVILPVVVVVNVTPVPTATGQTFCGSATVADLEATGTNLVWSLTEGGDALEATAALATGTYYVTQTIDGCASAATAVDVTVNSTPAPVAAAQAFCGSATVADLEATGTNLVWSLTEGGDALEATAALETGTYYVTQTVNGCTSTTATVAVTVNTIPDAPAALELQEFMDGETIAVLEVTPAEGATLTWWIMEGTTYVEVAATTELVNGETYYVSQSVNGCESGFTAITVTSEAGVEGFGLSRLVVYPNPTKDVVTLTNSSAITKVEVVNLLGQTVIAQNPNAENVQVDLANLASGTYLVRVATANASTTVKVVKQ